MEDFIVNELIFEMFLLDSVVDFVLAVDVELNVEVAVDWLSGGDDSLEKLCFEGGVLKPILVIVFVLAIIRWETLYCAELIIMAVTTELGVT